MDPTLKFIVFTLVSAASIVGGRTLRTRGLVAERLSRTVHLYTLIFLWSPVSVIAFWGIPINRELLAIMLIQPFVMVGSWLVTSAICRALKFSRSETGVMILAAALSNQGFTLGAFLCYVLLEPGREAMSYAVAFVTSMQVCLVLIFYPVARHYELAAEAESGKHVEHPPLAKLVIGSFLDIRAMPLYGATTGALLSLIGPAYPQWLIDNQFMLDIAFFVGAVGSYLGIGLRLRFGDSLKFVKHHAVLVGVKFIAMPVMTFAMLMVAKQFQPIGPLPTTVVVISSFCPTAINTVIVANLFHLNARLASVLWLWSTILFGLIVVPLIIVLV